MGTDLEKTIEKARGGLRKIQRTDLKTKKRYLAVLSSLAMIVIVGLWFFYLNLTLPEPSVEEIEEVRNNAVAIKEEKGNSFFRTIGQGAKNIFEDLKNQLMKFKENLGQVKEFTLEGGEAGFIPEEESLEPTSLP
jgi:hypothetical protein